MNLTRRERQCLTALDRLTVDGVGPSYDDMADALGIASRSGIHRLLTGLIERGYVERMHNRWRSAGLTKIGRELLAAAALEAKGPLGDLSDDALRQLARDVQAEVRRRTPAVAA